MEYSPDGAAPLFFNGAIGIVFFFFVFLEFLICFLLSFLFFGMGNVVVGGVFSFLVWDREWIST